MGAHPFSTGADQCLVHNGSLSNHNACAASCARGVRIETENDTEVGAAYLTWKMQKGATLGEALESSAVGSGRVLHLRRRHQGRLRRGARPDRLQARRDGRNRPIRGVRLANTARWSTCPASKLPASGNLSPPPSISGTTDMQTFDLEADGLRELNASLHALKPDQPMSRGRSSTRRAPRHCGRAGRAARGDP
jgi:hypothetical protein